MCQRRVTRRAGDWPAVWIRSLLWVWMGVLATTAGEALADGACCLEDGTCVELSALDCFFQGGEFSGEGSQCMHIDCTGACCLPDETCDDTLTQVQCEDLGGTFKGNGLQCDQVACGLRGACCLGDGGCIPSLTYNECTNGFDGTWMGYLTTCESPSVLNCRGGCCFDDGSCTPLVTADACDAAGGNFRDFGSRCVGFGDEICELVNPQATNAELHRQSFNFVMIDAVDRVFTFPKFDARDGLRRLRRVSIEIDGYVMVVVLLKNASDSSFDIDDAVAISEDLRVRFSENTDDLPTELQSVWAPDLPIIDQTVLCANNTLFPGQWCAFESPYFFPGVGNATGTTTFNPSVIVRGAGASQFVATPGDAEFDVILNGDSDVDSSLTGQGSITLNPHRAIGDIRVTYEFDLPLGACCLLDGTCIDYHTEADCLAEPGFYQWTAGRLCGELPAFQRDCQPRGACCLCDGECQEALTAAQCASLGVDNAFFLGMSCQDVADAGLGCAPSGSCCLPDQSCVQATEAQCDALSDFGVWEECGNCAVVFCEAIGACFLPSGVCEVRSEHDCEASNGTFLGAGTDCQQFESCDGDANFDGSVNLDDLLIVIGNWGTAASEGDVNFDGVVNLGDLLMVIGNWGCEAGGSP